MERYSGAFPEINLPSVKRYHELDGTRTIGRNEERGVLQVVPDLGSTILVDHQIREPQGIKRRNARVCERTGEGGGLTI